ncbi:MAG: ATP-dependent DNA helicase RecG [Pyrinomonadaceae bacterium]|nr:ATP-dependent DNA helicase RecG [Pyrinomonadaceae bacterium]
MTLSTKTPLTELYQFEVANLSEAMSRKLAAAAATYAHKTDIADATVEDLLNYFPMRYEDRSNMMPIEQLYDGLESSVELYARVSGGFRVGRNRGRKAPPLFIFEVTASDLERTRKPVVVWWFVSGKKAHHIVQYWSKKLNRGTRFIAYGRWEWDTRRNTFALKVTRPNEELEVLPGEADIDNFGLLKAASADSKSFEEAAEKLKVENKDSGSGQNDADMDLPEFAPIHVGRRVPVYRKFGDFQTKRLREITFDLLQTIDTSSIREMLPDEIVSKQDLISRARAVKEIHFPPEESNLTDYAAARSEAHKRLIFEEFFLVTFALQLKRGARKEAEKGITFKIPKKTRNAMRKMLPFKLTDAQRRVTQEIFSDMESDKLMNRLIQGDVGSGKTIVAFLAMFAALENGYQTVLMAPTEILAEQHARNAKVLFEKTDYRIELLTGSLRAAKKKKIQEEIANAKIDLVIGTHAVIQDAINFKNLGLAVIDEQHRFGVMQRAKFSGIGFDPDVLVMTATPIPRSLAMTVYGDLDVSVIDELPAGRTPVKTVVVGEDKRSGVYKGIIREIELGRQVYVVYPLVEESEKMDLKAAKEMFESLQNETFAEYKVGLIHGRMKPAEKESTMQDFVEGTIQILVSTTVIEVGVDVPNASLMVIEHAERFGLSQLHQLRGRVGRGAEQSYCVLLTADKKTVIAKERLGIMEETADGFKIAEKDLELRGQGDIFGTRQSGIQTFKIGNIIRDFEILDAARMEAEECLSSEKISKKTKALRKLIEEDPRFKLAGIG